MEPEISSEPVKSKSSLSFAMFIFGVFILFPITIFSIAAFHANTEHELKMECLKQNRSYVNGLCVQVSK